MLIRFNVENYLSFNEMQEFSMIGGSMRSKIDHVYLNKDIKLLKFACLFGANASGKSNLVSAIDFAKRVITNKLPSGHTNMYFKGDANNKQKKSYFEYEIKLDDKYYSYGFEIILSKSSIISEWLYEILPNGKDKEIFSRDVQKGTYSISTFYKQQQLKNKLNLYSDDIKDDDSILLLRVMNQNKDNFYSENKEAIVIKNIYNWIRRSLDINYPDDTVSNYSYFMMDDNIDEISRVIRAFGTGITEFKIVEEAPEIIFDKLPIEDAKKVMSLIENSKENKKNDDKIRLSRIFIRSNKNDFMIMERDNDGIITTKTIKFNHGSDTLFNLSEESDGTVRILDLLEVILNKKNSKTYVIDEIDRCLHPQLTYKFVETFLKLAKERNVQLIVTSHESRLLDSELLRRDEIWFVEKNKDGETRLYSLEEYNIRFDQKIDKAYLEGRYGGVPIFNTIYPIDGNISWG